MRVLLICDDYWHPGQIVIDGINRLDKNDYQFDIITNADDFSPDMLKAPTKDSRHSISNSFNYPAVLLCKMDEAASADRQPWKTEAVQNAFIDYVEGGGGLVAVHSAVVSGKKTDTLDKLIGCRFLSHPDACTVTVKPVKPHPVTEEISLFCETDEHYKIEIIAPDADILLASYSQDAVCAAGYVRTQGRGRICVLTPGHTQEVWQNPQFQRLIANAFKWVSGI